MTRAVITFYILAVTCVLSAADVDEFGHCLNAHPTVRMINQSTSDLSKTLTELEGNNNITSLTFYACLTESDMPAVNAAIATMSALKALSFIDVDSAILGLLIPDLLKTVNVFVGVSKPELSLRRVWKLP